MELPNDFASLPEPIVIQPIELPFCAQVDEEAGGEACRDKAETNTGEAYSAVAERNDSRDPYSVMLDHAYALLITGRYPYSYAI